MPQLSVNGTPIHYEDEGRGVPVVCVHGSFSDHRVWEPQREAVARRSRFIALDQRYFGTAPWPDDGAQFSQATHVADLGAFISGLDAGPVHLVGRSYGSAVSLALAVARPELVRRLFLHEPPVPSILTDAAELALATADYRTLAPVAAQVKSGDAAAAMRLFYEWVNGASGTFDAQPPAAQAMQLENARTVPAHFKAPRPAPLTCAQLRGITMPVAISMGELTRPYFRLLAVAAKRCIPGARLISIPGGRHGAPTDHAAAFNAALLTFLAGTDD